MLRTRAGGGDARTDKKAFLSQAGSILTAITAILAILISWLTLKLNRDGQFSARYTSAIEQFGNGNLQTRTGAIHLLGRIAVESSDDRPIIIGMLTDYVRATIGMGNAGPDVCRSRNAPPPDVVAAMRVLFFRIGRQPGDERLDLRRVCLADVELPEADLSCARLDESVIRYSNFDNAKFVSASMQYTKIGGSSLVDADLTRADAYGADFTNVDRFASTDLTGAQLDQAQLDQTIFVGADLTEADFTRARMDNADFENTDVTGARMATFLGTVRHLPSDVDRAGELASANSLPAPARSGVCS